MGNLVWKVMATAAAVGAGVVARKLTDGTWKFVSGGDSPMNPDDPEIDIKEAIIFALFSGALIALARMLANRETTKVLAKSQGKSRAQVADEA